MEKQMDIIALMNLGWNRWGLKLFLLYYIYRNIGRWLMLRWTIGESIIYKEWQLPSIIYKKSPFFTVDPWIWTCDFLDARHVQYHELLAFDSYCVDTSNFSCLNKIAGNVKSTQRLLLYAYSPKYGDYKTCLYFRILFNTWKVYLCFQVCGS